MSRNKSLVLLKEGISMLYISKFVEPHNLTATGTGQQSTVLTIADILKATSYFSEKNIIRQGTSCSIYKGKLKDGSQVAIKCARKLDGQYL